MRIKISFYESAYYTFDNIENYISINDNGKKFLTIPGIADRIGLDLKEYIIENYFNGAELAISYLGYSLENECFEFELIPN